jgi:hypothetical protein
MAILLAETLITLGASLQGWCQGQDFFVVLNQEKSDIAW